MNLDVLNDMQKKAVLQTEGPVLLLAGAGSGKTRALTYRIAKLVENGVSPWEILAITFTNKAAREMRERVSELVGSGAEHILVSTFHSACVRFLRRDIEKLGSTYTRYFTIYDTDDQKSVMKDCFKTLSIDDTRFKQSTVLAHISRLKDELIGPEEYEKDASDYYERTVAGVYSLYQSRLRRNNALDFDDIIFLTVKLFERNEHVLEAYRERFRYISVDEYQDTNTAQYVLVKLLAAKYGNVCVVGDDDQSIYGWRGANIQNIYNFEKDFPKTAIIKLEQNYRSTQNILNAANTVIANNFGRKEKSLWTQNGDGGKIKLFAAENEHEEARYIAAEIKRQSRPCADFGILYRTNAQSRALEEAFINSDLPYKIYGGVRFYERKEVRDVLAYLKIIVNPKDDVSARRVINVPKRGAGKVFVDTVSNYAQENSVSFLEALKCMAEEKAKIPSKVIDFLEMIGELSEVSSEGKVVPLIEELLEKTEYMKMLEDEGDEYESDSRAANVQQLISKAVEYERETEGASEDESSGLQGFLANVALVAEIDSHDESDGTISVMTMHNAKGLEFPVVFLTGLEEGLFPGYNSITVPQRLEEERRLFYVGITRAREALYITRAKSRMSRGITDYCAPSRFLKELPGELVETDRPQGTNPKRALGGGVPKKPEYTPASFKNVMRTMSTNVEIDYIEGDSVIHQKFGEGLVVSLAPAGKDYEVTVDFPEKGRKKFMAMLSGLRKA